jgi:hypothetical protein
LSLTPLTWNLNPSYAFEGSQSATLSLHKTTTLSCSHYFAVV